MPLNRTLFAGRLTRDLLFQAHASDNAKDRCWGSIANNRMGSKDEVDYMNFVCWGAVARATAEKCQKGKEITLDGSVHTTNKQRVDKNGEPLMDTEGKPVWDNYVEVSAGLVYFGNDAKNTPEVADNAATPDQEAAATLVAALKEADLSVGDLVAAINSNKAASSADTQPRQDPFPHQ